MALLLMLLMKSLVNQFYSLKLDWFHSDKPEFEGNIKSKIPDHILNEEYL